MRFQRTLKKSVEIKGTGLHSGREVTLRLHPAPENHGIVFHRSDLGSVYIPAHVRFVSSEKSTLSTVLYDGQATVQTIEHLLSALNGLYLDNVIAEIDGAELPILDGSAKNVLASIHEAGIVEQKKPQKYYRVNRSQEFVSGTKYLKAEPSDRFEVDYEIDFGPGLVQRFVFVLGEESYGSEISKAKTFCFESDIQKMRSMGLAKGGSLSNALVMGKNALINPEQQTYPDEFVRHKILDFLGDVRLLDRPVVGRFTVRRGGHAFHTECLRALWESGNLQLAPERGGKTFFTQSTSPVGETRQESLIPLVP
ncbi:MAG: UDP-3-O-acyl-N-acetylglucosamine deacetylase [Nitrospirota bacterium]|nr:UDP-3-O-acyl-N-acetylglucosamine deacetylase [Nitrospirota bacterium]